MTTLLEARPGGFDRLLRLIVDHNPFYLLSAVMMLLGVFMVNNAEELKPGDLSKLLFLLLVLNVYEALVILLGRALVWRPTVPRDGITLLILEALFFADGTFLSAETVMTNSQIGAVINLAMLLLAIGKSAIILRTMRIRVTVPLLAFLAVQLAALFTLPVILRANGGNDRAIDFILYGAWWALGIMPLVFDLLSRAFPVQMGAHSGTAQNSRAIRLVYVIVPFISLGAHIGFLHWVYKAPFSLAEFAPLCLGAAIALGRLPDRKATAFWRVILPVMAVIISLGNPAFLQFEFITGFPAFTPLRAAMAGTYLTLAYVFFFSYLLYFVAGGALLAGMVIFGPTWETMLRIGASCWQFVLDLIRRFTPRTNTAWGILMMAFSFALLGVGGAVSWLSHTKEGGRGSQPPSVP